MLDCIIIGGGMAGISAALTLKAQGRDFVLLGAETSAKIKKAERIMNYPAFIGGTGEELSELLSRQVAAAEIEIVSGRAAGVYAGGGKVTVQTSLDRWLEAKTVILATGAGAAASVPGESEYIGRGVSYCATCDGALYKGKTAVVVAGSAGFEEDVALLENFAAKLYFVPLYKGCGYVPKKPATEIFTDALVRIEGDLRVKKAVFRLREVETDGVFLLKESAPLSVLCGGLKTDGAHVITDRDMRTNLPGVFAAGDCTGRPYQLAKAAGEGCVAAFSASRFIELQGDKKD